MTTFRKILCLTLALSCLLLLAACNPGGGSNGNGKNEKTIFSLIGAAQPTKTTTFVNYALDETKLEGEYRLTVDGSKMKFEYSFERLATVEDGAGMIDAGGEITPVKTVDGTIYYNDGRYYAGSEWESGSVIPEKFALSFNLKPEYLASYKISTDGLRLTASVDGANVEKVFGTELNARGPLSLTVTSDGSFIRSVLITYTSLDGAAVEIETSYSYGAQTVELPNA